MTIASRMALALVLLVPCVAHAGIEKAGTTAANFLSVGSGARIHGMGGAVLGLGRDLNATAWNAAALGWVTDTEFALSHSGLSDAQAQEWAAAAGRFGLSNTRWALTGLYHGQGTFEGRDASGVSTGSFDVSSMAVGAHVAQAFGDRATIGLGVKYVSEDLGSVQGSGVTFDAGLQVRAGQFGFGVAGQNIAGSMSYDGTSYPFPSNIGAGVSMDIPESGLRFALDANFPEAYYSDVRGGVEWMWREQFALRAGYRAEMGADAGEPLTGPSFGMGAGIAGLWFDYGYLISGPGDGGEHRLGITLRPGQMNLGSFGQGSRPDVSTPPPVKAPKKKAAPKKKKAVKKPAPAKAEPKAAVPVEEKKPQPKTAEPVKEPEAKKPERVVEAPKESAPAKDEPVRIPEKHKVKSGETLYRIATMYRTTVPKLMDLNNMVNTTIHVGQVLRIPQPE